MWHHVESFVITVCFVIYVQCSLSVYDAVQLNPEWIKLKVTRSGTKMVIQYKVPSNDKWILLRKFQFFAGDLQVGLMACSPQRKNAKNKFRATFRNFSLWRTSEEIDDPIPDEG